jgi:hypothetical protein
MSGKEEILKTLEPLFIKADKEGLWFHSAYQDMWFTPNELREQQANGRYLWGAVNWELRSPQVKIDELNRCKANIDKQIADILQKI